MADDNKEREGTELSEFVFKWWLDDANKPVILSEDHLSVVFHPRRSTGCCALRGDKPLLKHMEHWFEVEMQPPFQGQARMVGLGDKFTRLQSNSKDFYPLIGRDRGSWGLNYNGYLFHDGQKTFYTDVDTENHLRIGVYYDSYYGIIAFTVNDKSHGIAFQNISIGLELYPLICSTSRGSKMKLLYSYSSIISLKALCRGCIKLYVKEEKNIEQLPIPQHLKAYLLFKNYEPPKYIKDYTQV